MAALRSVLASGTAIVGLELSRLRALRDEFYSLGLDAEIGQLGKQAFLFEEFLVRAAMRGDMTLPPSNP